MLLAKKIPFRYVFGKVRKDAITVLGIASLVELVLHLNRGYLPELPGSVPAFLGTAISLILSFKLSQSYDRWWEARKIWGAIVNDSRTLVRQVLSFAGENSEVARKMCRRQIAWCYCLGQSLRRLDWKAGTVEHLNDEDIARAEKHSNKPVALLQYHAQDAAKLAADGQLTDFQRITVEDTLRRLTDAMGKAERIKNTVFPETYRIFLHAFIYLFITLLSIALYEVQHAWQIAITTIISIPFFLLEKTAVHMQDPFENRPTDTAMTTIARTIEINIRQLLGDTEVPEPLPPEGFYSM